MTAMRIISFNNTALLKRGIWLSIAALTAYAAAPALSNGGPWRVQLASLLPLGVLLCFWAYFLRRTAFYRLADEVIDCIDHLEVRSGRAEARIALRSISTIEVASYLRVHWISIRLTETCALGDRIAFLPQASLWGNLPAIRRMASQLSERARPTGHRPGGPPDA
jgi:hypothetical protein